MSMFNRFLEKLFYPKDITTLVIFRIAFGAIILWEVVRYFDTGRIKRYFIDNNFNFTFEFFEWVKPWEGNGMFIHFYILGILSVFMIIGLFYRLTAFLIFILFTYIFLLEEANYLNHFYLTSLISLLMIFIPAHKKYSIDSIIWKKIRSDSVPSWSVNILQFQMGIAYFYGGVAKLNYDWLFRAEPMQHWLYSRTDYPIIGKFFDEQWMAFFMSWSGTLIDLLAPFLLLNRKCRPFMFLTLVSFHFMNDRLFSIGIFPWFGIMASTVFFPSDYAKSLIQTFRSNKHGFVMTISAIIFSLIGMYFHKGFDLVPFLVSFFAGAVISWLFIDLIINRNIINTPSNLQVLESNSNKNVVIGFLFFWTIFQVAMPLRHFFIPGNVSWTEEGHRFSWHMKLRSKSGFAKFYSCEPVTQEIKEIDCRKYLSERQYSKMSTRPYMILEFAKFLKEELKKEGKENYEIRVIANISYNFRPPQQLIKSNIDLSTQSYSDFKHNNWIIQLNPKLKPRTIKESMNNDVIDMGE